MLPQDYTQGVFDPATGGGKPLIPVGTYKAMVVDSELKATSSNGYMLVLKVLIVDGEYKGTELVERLNLVHSNQQTVQIAGRTLDAVCAAVGLTSRPSDSSAIHNKHFMIETKNVKSKDWVDDNGQTREGTEGTEIKKYLPLPKSGMPPSQPSKEVQATVTSIDKSPF
jgi:hypothetical protein